MLEPIPICFDNMAFDAVLDTVFSSPLPDAQENELMPEVDNDELVDFSDPLWDSLFDSFQDNVDGLDPIPLITHETENLSKLEKRKREDYKTTDGTKRCRSVNNLTLEPEPLAVISVPTPTTVNLFATPRHTWSMAKQNRFDALQRLNAKRREGRFSMKPTSKYSVRKKLASHRKRTNKGQFARTSKFKWVSVTDL